MKERIDWKEEILNRRMNRGEGNKGKVDIRRIKEGT